MNDSSNQNQDGRAEGLRAAFRAASSSAAPLSTQRSVLRIPQEKTASRLDLHLHDVRDDSGVPARVDAEVWKLRDPSGRTPAVSGGRRLRRLRDAGSLTALPADQAEAWSAVWQQARALRGAREGAR